MAYLGLCVCLHVSNVSNGRFTTALTIVKLHDHFIVLFAIHESLAQSRRILGRPGQPAPDCGQCRYDCCFLAWEYSGFDLAALDPIHFWLVLLFVFDTLHDHMEHPEGFEVSSLTRRELSGY